MGKKIFILTFGIWLFWAQSMDAQQWRTRRFEATLGIGTANLYGDIGGALSPDDNGLSDIQIEFTRPVLTSALKFRINRRLYARTNLALAYFSSNDKGAAPELTREFGGYKFNSFVIEPSVMAEFYILPEARTTASNALYNRHGMVNSYSQINVYLFTGVGGVVNFPTLTYINTGEIVNDIYTPDPEDFRRVGIVIPFGVGIKYHLTSLYTMSAEFGRRYTFTDYIDGYTSKFSKANDVYDFMTFSIGYKIRTDRRGRPIIFRKTGLR